MEQDNFLAITLHWNPDRLSDPGMRPPRPAPIPIRLLPSTERVWVQFVTVEEPPRQGWMHQASQEVFWEKPVRLLDSVGRAGPYNQQMMACFEEWLENLLTTSVPLPSLAAMLQVVGHAIPPLHHPDAPAPEESIVRLALANGIATELALARDGLRNNVP